MTTAVLRQSGGSVILSIPRAFAQSMGVGAQSSVCLSLRGRTLTVSPAYSIDQVLAGVTDENRHELIDAGERGAEKFD